MEDKLEWNISLSELRHRDTEQMDVNEMMESIDRWLSNPTLSEKETISFIICLDDAAHKWYKILQSLKDGRLPSINELNGVFNWKERVEEWYHGIVMSSLADTEIDKVLAKRSKIATLLALILEEYANPSEALLINQYQFAKEIHTIGQTIDRELFEWKSVLAGINNTETASKKLNKIYKRLYKEIVLMGLGEDWEDFFSIGHYELDDEGYPNFSKLCITINEVEVGRLFFLQRIDSKIIRDKQWCMNFFLLLQKWFLLEQKRLNLGFPTFPFDFEEEDPTLSHDVPVSKEAQTSTSLPPAPAEKGKPFQAPEEANCLAGAVLRNEAVFQAFVERLREAASFIYQRTNKRMTAWKWCFLLYALRELQLIDKETSYKAFAVMVAALVPQPDMTAEQQANNIKSNVQYHIAKPDAANNARNQKLTMSIKAHFQPVADLMKAHHG